MKNTKSQPPVSSADSKMRDSDNFIISANENSFKNSPHTQKSKSRHAKEISLVQTDKNLSDERLRLGDVQRIIMEDLADFKSEYPKRLDGLSMDLMPKVEFKQGELCIRFPMPGFNHDMLEGILRIAKSYIPNLRIRSWMRDDYRFQAMNDNVFNTEGLDERIFFTIQGLFGNYNFLVKRKSFLSRDEVQFVLDAYRLIFNAREKVTPEDLLMELGVIVINKDDSVSWDGFAGYERVKREVSESVILPFQKPEVYESVLSLTRSPSILGKNGNKSKPRAILFSGPPGVGKTTMARMIAHEVGVPLLYIPIESIISKYYGQSSKNLSHIFEIASQYQSAILFLDEIDSLAGSRNEFMFEATRRVLSVLLRYVDGLDSKSNILTLGATNRMSDLDSALLSRFDHVVRFDLPDEPERRAILKNFARQLSDSDMGKISGNTAGFSGRNLKDICEYAERWWARHIILQGLEVSPPPLEAYMKALEIRQSINSEQ